MKLSVVVKAFVALSLMFSLFGDQAFAQSDYETSFRQGKIHFKAGRYREAVKELRNALSTVDGEKSFDATFLYAQAAFKSHSIGEAVEYAQLAMELAPDSDSKKQAARLSRTLEGSFGKVEFYAKDDEAELGYLIIEPLDEMPTESSEIYFVEKIGPLLEQQQSLPQRMWLPVNDYKVNGRQFEVIAGELLRVSAGLTPEVVAFQNEQILDIRKAEEAERRRRADWFGHRSGAPNGIYIAARAGGAMVAGSGRDASMAPLVDGTLLYEFGRFGLGAFGEITPLSLELENPAAPGQISSTGASDPTVGLIATARFYLPKGLSVMPGAGLAVGAVGGGVYYCNGDTAESAYDASSQTVTVTYEDCGTDAGAYAGAANMQAAHVQEQGPGPVGRVDLLFEKETKFGYIGANIGLQALALISKPNQVVRSESTGTIQADDDGDGVYTDQEVTFVDELVLSNSVGGSALRVGVMAGINLSF